MPLQKQLLVLAASALLAMTGCAKDIYVSSTWDPLDVFPKQATYAWDESASKLPTDPRLQALDLGPSIRQSADKAFAEHGYTVTTGTADYHLSYQLAVHTFIGPEKSSAGGTLSLQMIKVSTGHRVWTGFGRSDVHVGATPEAREARLDEVMREMLKGFPPNQN